MDGVSTMAGAGVTAAQTALDQTALAQTAFSSAFSWASLTPLWPELFLAVAAMALLVLGLFQGENGARLISRLAIGAFAVTALLVAMGEPQRVTALNGFFVVDGFASYMKLLVLGGLIAVTALSVRYLYLEQMARFEYPVLVMLAGLGMMIMLSANNLLSVYMGLELQSLSLYVLAAIRRDSLRSSEAGLKYFVLGALASGMLLFGISLIYGYTGGIGFDGIKSVLAASTVYGGLPSPGLTIGLVFLLVGVAFKVSAVPFHMWTPDVYEGAPTSVTALFAIVPKVAAIGLLVRLLFDPFAGAMDQWQQVLWALSAASMALGAFAALVQTNIKRLMAYSSIGHMGYALMGVVAGTVDGIGSLVLYMLIYMVMSAGVFGIILMMRRNGTAVEKISDLAGLSQHSPALGYALALLMFSMSGIPPLAGFFGKLVVFQSAIASGFFVLAVIGVLSSVVAAYYYLRVIKVMFFDEPADAFDKETSLSVKAVVAASVLFIVLFILKPQWLVLPSYNAASAFFL